MRKIKPIEHSKPKQKNSVVRSVLILSLLSVAIIVFFKLDCTCIQSITFQQINAQNLDMRNGNQEERFVNDTALLDSYEELLANNYPYPIHYVEKFAQGPAIIYDGIIMSKNSKPEDAEFSEWGLQRNLNLYNYPGPNQNISLFNIEGNSRDYPSGFMSAPLQFTDNYISLNLGNIDKDPESAQVTLQFEVVGDKDKYFINFVNGRLTYEGWLENTYNKKITSNSSHLIDLSELISIKGDKYLYLDRININVEKDTEIDKFQFRIDLGQSTLNTPSLVSNGLSYFVNGYVFQDYIISSDYSYSFDDWQFKQKLTQEFTSSLLDNPFIATNNWIIKEATKSLDNSTNEMNIKLVSERNMPLWEPPIIDVLMNYDIQDSLAQFGSPKDILFSVTVALLVLVAFYKRKTTSAESRDQ